MFGKAERARSAILRVLAESAGPLGAERIVASLLAAGVDLSPRTVRLHLLELDRKGLTRLVNRRAGRTITREGREETGRADVITKVGVVSARVDALTYRMTFDARRGAGTVVVNAALLHPANLEPALAETRRVLREQLGIANRVVVARAGEQIGGVAVPPGFVGIGTLCSVTMNGILLHRGIPVTSRFGGLLEVRDRRPLRFVELIEYRGSSLDPLEVFIQAGMTRVRDVVRQGSGVICAGFREIPAPAAEDAQALVRELRPLGIGGIVAVGRPNQPLFGIPVADGHAGLVVVGGLNPIAAVREAGYAVRIRSLAGLEDFARLQPVEAAGR
jgi:repressor of nif and glnA expression